MPLQAELPPPPGEVWLVHYHWNDNAGKSQVLSAFFEGRPTLDQFLLQAEASRFTNGQTTTVLRVLRVFVGTAWEELHHVITNEMVMGAPTVPVGIPVEAEVELPVPSLHVTDLMTERTDEGGESEGVVS